MQLEREDQTIEKKDLPQKLDLIGLYLLQPDSSHLVWKIEKIMKEKWNDINTLLCSILNLNQDLLLKWIRKYFSKIL